jgi:hypothetical protein
MGEKLYVDRKHTVEDEGTEVAEGSQVVRVEASECLEMA